ncbi:cytochrome c biogenesis protein [Youhaiella tibetensis]|uniref:Cytochrome c-type biogenesis protein n=1 Tax=Paradevosia tibetensis TaxID=1447062 RepID=A0A5B9DL30_9HYPH|nr:cytochrome c-type biogenesis protein [Youhaiella tibetensis]QEE19873.1 cytochrome c-type biogenesis protein CcmH [Youhaiella tibetensis]GGF29147.1 cytochrome c biogenesis protein [Youhaiella tibetensis]
MRRFFVALAIVFAMGSAAMALNPSEILSDPVLEARARDISAGLRCLVCQNQSIEDSDADLAHDLRVIVRERLVAGDTDEQVRDYVVARYGEFVLLQPVLGLHTLVLWIAAPLLLIAGIIAVVVGIRRRRAPMPAALTAEEQAALDRLEERQEH